MCCSGYLVETCRKKPTGQKHGFSASKIWNSVSTACLSQYSRPTDPFNDDFPVDEQSNPIGSAYLERDVVELEEAAVGEWSHDEGARLRDAVFDRDRDPRVAYDRRQVLNAVGDRADGNDVGRGRRVLADR